MARLPQQPRKYRPRPTSLIDARHIAYTGMRDSKDPSTSNRRKASLIYNMYPVLSEVGGALEGRPGYEQLATQLTGRTQLIFQFSKLNGSEYTVVINNGRFYTYNWGTDAFDEVLTGANLTSAGVTLDTSAKVSAVIFADKLILTDGVNTPWMWDGTTGGGITLLSNAPVAYGPPTVYYAKLFFIKANERTTMVWSEENDPTTGYEAGGFNNAWTLGQTDQESLYRLYGTNDALFYWRARSMGSITGSVNEDFRSTGTHDSVSQTIGTVAPWSVQFHNESFIFIDAEGHPQRFVLGSGMQFPPIWEDAQETTDRLSPLKFSNIRTILRGTEDVIQIAFTPIGDDENEQSLIYSADTGEFQGIWEYATALVEVATIKDTNGKLWTAHATADGFFYRHGSVDGTLWSDAGVAITHTLWSSPFMWDPREEKFFSRLDASFRLESNLTNVGFSFIAPGCSSLVLSPAALTGDLSIWGVAIWGTSVWSAESVETHLAVGIDCRGRWLQVRMNHNTLDERIAFVGWTLLAQSMGRDPGIA